MKLNRKAHGYIVLNNGAPCIFDDKFKPNVDWKERYAMIFPNYEAARKFKRQYARMIADEKMIENNEAPTARPQCLYEASEQLKIIRLV